MIIGGLQKLTLIDFPGKVAATVFLFGCNFRCPYCHNPDLVNPSTGSGQVKESDFLKFLDERTGFLDGICITGGEPTINSELPKFIQNIKRKGFLVKLDTNGSNPEMLEDLVNNDLVDFIAMDIKTSVLKYKEVGAKNEVSRVKKSAAIIKSSNKDYEFRTTVAPKIVDEQDIEDISKWLKGSKKFVLQQFRPASLAGGPGKVLSPAFKTVEPYPVQKLEKMLKILEPHVDIVELRL